MARLLAVLAVVALVFVAAPPTADAQLLWSVRVTCSTEPHIPIGIWFSVVSLHNPTTVPVAIDWQVITEDGGIEGSGTFTLGPDEVEEIDCFESPFDLPPSGFFEIQARRLIQVVVTNKNIEVSEYYEDKGYPVPAQQVGAETWSYSSEFVCGDLEPVAPGSVLDLLAMIPEEELGRVWRPGRSLTELFVYNPTNRPVLFDFRAVTSDGETLVLVGGQTVAPRSATRIDCDVLPSSDVVERAVLAPRPRTDGAFVIEASSPELSVRFDKETYVSIFAAAMEIEYPRPIRRQLAAGASTDLSSEAAPSEARP